MREYVEELTKEKAEEYLTPLLETYRVAGDSHGGALRPATDRGRISG